jgi:methoxymalonate biosynthesis protein
VTSDVSASPDNAVIKCVVWDVDNTLLDGVYLESADQPPPADPVLTGVLRELSDRGILQALATRNPPEVAQYVRAVTGADFVAAECGWGSKAQAIGRISADLDVPADAIAFVDDDMLERAEVAAALPDVLVLTPEDAAEAASWPQFSPAVVTAEARRRGQLYADRRRRHEAAAAFGGSRDQFLRQVGTRITIARATAADLPRVHELSVRTHQLNSGGQAVTEEELASLLASGDHQVATLRLADDFGDDGLVGAAILARNGATVTVPSLMMSCRALGRGALDALLAWACGAAAQAAATELAIPCLVTDRNVPMRLALAAAGLRAEPGSVTADGRALFRRSLTGDLPALASWVTVAASP